ncbi:MAG: C40 family peptidase [Vreelandella alkaliphila]|uniref:NlpC/P60 family protein n=1 Tax=Halomonas campaniensis TaxID=213554 RepID=A0A3D0KI42_9GAMM|nr:MULTISPECIES: C40 family peptidase [unclassified Halomonas]UTD57256.1 C40 family peptidase [Halomonas sp. MS1]HBP40728.1 NlpC/P60 family protein [Halomonas sp.]HBS83127.1 NlpC/P60 family protein [Halomonas campaniensis]HCA03257.1 NlpC/P60 family protein [Halomonas campaniensis]
MPFIRLSPLLTLFTLLLLAGCASKEITTAPASNDQAGISMERALILSHAQQAIGTPYRFGGNTPEGLDCSGLVEMTYRAAGIRVPRTANDQFRSLPSVDAPRPGDLLFFGDGAKATHVGIYGGNRQMIHAPGSGRAVVSVPLDIDYWNQRFLGAASPAP